MNTNIETTTSDVQTRESSQFIKLLLQDGAGEYRLDFDHLDRPEKLKAYFAERNGSKFLGVVDQKIPDQFVAQQSLERYFGLLELSLKDLQFDINELTIIMNTTCGPVWQWQTYDSVASMVADDNGIEDLDELSPGSVLRELLKKLIALSPLQNAALVDFCEKFWRARSDIGFEEQCAALGLTVID
ncbi:hypothetical protein [Rhodoferax sp.]|uniref:hypothetical protein n=1 Tax=Rhodoferax sp. TaxID=50421 RepID=UPI0026191D0A|nr:hypothetical protein [Rhodoferax sp.]MDD2811152.1 hypothetical protein [Rhodoferax sp.]MDD4943532.1 hypothetical protein [Rhodoferax sp.]